MRLKKIVWFHASAVMVLLAGTTNAAIPPDEIARLGEDLTPLGAERAGNAEGTIPEWTGGIRSPAEAGFPDFQTGGHHPNPFASDAVLLTITAENMAQYADQLTEGQKALLSTYPDSFRMKVYPTHRSAAFPQYVYDMTRQIAATAQLADEGKGVVGAIQGIPFPIPSNGLEAIWNHILRFRALRAIRNIGQAPVTRGGGFTLVQFIDTFLGAYSLPDMTEEELNNVIIYFKQRITAPARLAGQILLVYETLDQAREIRKAWIYNPGQRRVRRAPNVAFDNPREGSDGLATSDQFDMYNGSPERYDWTLVGKKEIYVPYNNYELHSGELTYKEILQPGHINPEFLRYELHRVWVVDAVMKPKTRHIYKRRTFYLDEDSWQAVAVDCYDTRDQLWRVQEGYGINYYEIPNYWTTVEAVYDLQSKRYLALGLNNEARFTYDFSADVTLQDFTQAALRRAGVR